MHTAPGLRRTLAGACLIAFPLLGLASAVIAPKFGGDIAAEVAYIAEHEAQWSTGMLLMLLSFFLAIPAVSALAGLIRGRWLLPGHIGAGLAMLGAYFHGAILGFALVEVPLATSEIERAQVVSFVAQSGEHPTFVMLLLPFAGFYLGSVILTLALWRARVMPWWAGVLILVGLAAQFVGPLAISNYVFFGAQTLAYGYLGLQVLRMSDGGPEPSTTPVDRSSAATAHISPPARPVSA